jgi:hypothetical protein
MKRTFDFLFLHGTQALCTHRLLFAFCSADPLPDGTGDCVPSSLVATARAMVLRGGIVEKMTVKRSAHAASNPIGRREYVGSRTGVQCSSFCVGSTAVPPALGGSTLEIDTPSMTFWHGRCHVPSGGLDWERGDAGVVNQPYRISRTPPVTTASHAPDLAAGCRDHLSRSI